MDVNKKLKFRDVLYDNSQLGPYPDHLLKRVGKPTTLAEGPTERRDAAHHALANNFNGTNGKLAQARAPQVTIEYPVARALTEMQHHINSYKEKELPVSPFKAEIPDDPTVLSRHIKSLGYFLGADLVGICKMPDSAYYTNDWNGNEIPTKFKYAIVLLCSKSNRSANASNGFDWIFDSISFQAYQRLAMQTETMASYIRLLGHESEASNMYTYLTLMPELILRAGLGEVSRLGIVVNPFLGANYKSAAVLTNLELTPDEYIDFGLQDFCENCEICAEQCPSGALPKGKNKKAMYNGYETWKIDEKKCAVFDAMNTHGNVCGRCSKMCPWSRKDSSPAVFKDWDGSIEALHRDALARMEEMAANNYVEKEELTGKWWFDLIEDAPGTFKYVVPQTSIKEDIY